MIWNKYIWHFLCKQDKNKFEQDLMVAIKSIKIINVLTFTGFENKLRIEFCLKLYFFLLKN